MCSFFSFKHLLLIAGLILVTPLHFPAAIARQTTDQAVSESDDQASKFLRFVEDGQGGGTLQASTVRYENSDGVVVDLVAAVHIAEPSFYRALNDSFEDYDAVLYELVAPKDMLEPTGPGSEARRLGSTTWEATRERSRSLNWVGTLQRFLRDTLKLSFQLEAIDYKQPNFIHADLDAETFTQMQSERGESMFSLMLRSMMREMSRPGAAANAPGLGDLIFAMQSPDKARQLKLLLGRQFNEIDQQLNGFEGPKGSVILTERNKAAMKVLKHQLSQSDKRNIAIFYGAGHLKGMEKMLTQDMGFHQVGPPIWRVAWDMIDTKTIKPSTSTRPATRAAR